MKMEFFVSLEKKKKRKKREDKYNKIKISKIRGKKARVPLSLICSGWKNNFFFLPEMKT